MLNRKTSRHDKMTKSYIYKVIQASLLLTSSKLLRAADRQPPSTKTTLYNKAKRSLRTQNLNPKPTQKICFQVYVQSTLSNLQAYILDLGISTEYMVVKSNKHVAILEGQTATNFIIKCEQHHMDHKNQKHHIISCLLTTN